MILAGESQPVIFEQFELPAPGVVVYEKLHDRHFHMDFHVHAVYEISFVFEGAGELSINDKTFLLKKGDLFIINDRFAHRVRVNPKSTLGFYVTIFDPSLLSVRYPEYMSTLFFPSSVDHFVYPQLEPYTSDIFLSICRIMDEQRNRGIGYEMKIESCFFAMIVSLTRMQCQLENQKISPLVDADEQRRRFVMSFIHHNYFKPLSLNDVASLIHISPRQCANLIKKWYGCTFTDLVTEVRIGIAQKLLAESGKSVTFIAYEVGYEDTSHFIRTFKKRLGVTPLEYRRHYAKEQTVS